MMHSAQVQYGQMEGYPPMPPPYGFAPIPPSGDMGPPDAQMMNQVLGHMPNQFSMQPHHMTPPSNLLQGDLAHIHHHPPFASIGAGPHPLPSEYLAHMGHPDLMGGYDPLLPPPNGTSFPMQQQQQHFLSAGQNSLPLQAPSEPALMGSIEEISTSTMSLERVEGSASSELDAVLPRTSSFEKPLATSSYNKVSYILID